MSGLAIRVAVAAADTATSPQNLDASGGTLPGESPIAALYGLTSGTALGTAVQPARLGLGVTEGTTQRAFGALAEDGQATLTADAQTRNDNATVVQFPVVGSGAIDGEAAWSSWRTNGSQITWPDFLTAAHQLGAIYFFGTECRAAVAQLTGSSSIGGTANVTGLAFRPNLAIALCIDTAFPADTDSAHWRSGIGFAVQGVNGAIEQAGSYMSVRDRASPNTSCAQNFYNTGFMRRVLANAAGGRTDGARLVMQSFDWDHTTGGGCTVRTEDVAESVVVVLLLLYVPHQLAVRTPSLGTDSTGSKPVTGLGFKPIDYFAIGTNMATSSVNTAIDSANAGHISFGVRTQDEELCFGATADDNAVVSASWSVTASDVVRVLNDAGGIEWAGSHTSFDDDGVHITIDTASSGDRLVALLFIGPRVSRALRGPMSPGALRLVRM